MGKSSALFSLGGEIIGNGISIKISTSLLKMNQGTLFIGSYQKGGITSDRNNVSNCFTS